MPDNLEPGTFKIFSRTEGNPPVAVNLTLPGSQPVRINGGPVQEWVFRKGDDGNYRLNVGDYPFCGIIDGKVIATIDPEQGVAWEITYRECNDAYTIANANDNIFGWTIPLGDFPNAQVEMAPLISTRSIPPQFMATQLFTLERVE